MKNIPYEGRLPEHVQKVLDSANVKIKDGAEIYFKWTCGRCGSRQTFPDKNAFYMSGECEECKHITSLLDPAANVNYAMIQKCATPEDFDRAIKPYLGKQP